MAKFKKIQGESLAFTRGIVLDGATQNFSAGWTCKMEVKPVTGGLDGAASISKTITDLTDSDERYLVKIAPSEMANLAVGDYHLITELSNVGVGFNDETQDLLEVSQQGIV